MQEDGSKVLAHEQRQNTAAANYNTHILQSVLQSPHVPRTVVKGAQSVKS
jgi:hypothetical protein